jgi:hypothetical protein
MPIQYSPSRYLKIKIYMNVTELGDISVVLLGCIYEKCDPDSGQET